MKAAIFEKTGLENPEVVDNVKEPETNDHDVLIRVKVAGVNPIDNFVVFGALPKLIPLPNHILGAEVRGIVEDVASHVKKRNRVADQVKEITQGKMADVVLNLLGIETCESSYAPVSVYGRWVTFGTLTGPDAKLNLQSLYTKQIKLIGSTGVTEKN